MEVAFVALVGAVVIKTNIGGCVPAFEAVINFTVTNSFESDVFDEMEVEGPVVVEVDSAIEAGGDFDLVEIASD